MVLTNFEWFTALLVRVAVWLGQGCFARVAFIGLCFEGFVFAKDVLLLKLLGLVCRLVLVHLYFDIWGVVSLVFGIMLLFVGC